MFCGFRHLKVDHQKCFPPARFTLTAWRVLELGQASALSTHHGVSQTHFPLYLKELEFRYITGGHDLFDLVANYYVFSAKT